MMNTQIFFASYVARIVTTTAIDTINAMANEAQTLVGAVELLHTNPEMAGNLQATMHHANEAMHDALADLNNRSNLRRVAIAIASLRILTGKEPVALIQSWSE